MKKYWILGLALVAMFMLSGTAHASLWGGWWGKRVLPLIDGIGLVFGGHHGSSNTHSYDTPSSNPSNSPNPSNPPTSNGLTNSHTKTNIYKGSECTHPKPVTHCDTKHGAKWGGCCGAEICCNPGCIAACNDAGGNRRSYCDCFKPHHDAGGCTDAQGDQYAKGACIGTASAGYQVCMGHDHWEPVEACPGADPPMKGGGTGGKVTTTTVPYNVESASYKLLHNGKNPAYPAVEVQCRAIVERVPSCPTTAPRLPGRLTTRPSDHPTIPHKKTINKSPVPIDAPQPSR